MIYKKIHLLKLSLFSLAILILGISCKDKPQADATPPAPEPEVEMVKSLAPAYKEIANFMELKVSDSTRIDTVLSFKALMGKDSIVDTDSEKNLKYYKDIMRNGRAKALPIFEVKGSDLSLLLLTGKGYVGALWARILIDKSTGKIVKARFGHKMESEGYGDGIASSAFGDQFGDKQLVIEGNTYGLNQSGKLIIEGSATVDGISGATATSSALVQMLNEGLKRYGTYLAR